MSGAAIEIIPSGLEALNGRINRLLRGLKDPKPLLWDLAQAGEEQTRRRLADEKHGPDGERWPEWSPGYAATRHGGQDKLESTGDLIESINAFADAQTAGWGTNVKYAATHQFGRDAIPARPYLGVSDENLTELLDIAERWLDRMLWGQS
ncbi:MAG: phage virion morphogenesis protein [Candidatus Competibacter denitrificans]